MSAFLDQFPPSNHALYPPPPPQLPTVSSQIPPLLPSPRPVNSMERRSALGYFRPNSRQSRMDRIGDHRNTRIHHRHLVRGGLLLISIKRTLIVSESCCLCSGLITSIMYLCGCLTGIVVMKFLVCCRTCFLCTCLLNSVVCCSPVPACWPSCRAHAALLRHACLVVDWLWICFYLNDI